MKVHLLAAAAIAAVPFAAVAAQNWHSVQTDNQPIVQGSGRIVNQARAVGQFDRVELGGAANLEVRLGAARSVTITADDNILPFLTSEVRGGTLKLGTRGSFRTRTAPRVRITAPDLASIATNGSGDVVVTNVSNARFDLASRGSGDLRAAGRTGRLNVAIQGSGSANLAALDVRDARVAIHGSGDAAVRASGALDASVFGSGTIRYLGRPASLNVQRAGSGRVVAASR